MPELPDVEMYKRYAEATVLHKKIVRVEISDDKLIKVSRQTMKKHLEGVLFEGITRVGKYLFIKTSGKKILVVHFGMTGAWKYFKDEADTPKYNKVLFHFDNGFKLSYVSKRKLGRLDLIDGIASYKKSHQIGDDATEISLKQFKNSLEGKKTAIKAFLLSQKYMSGIGNWMADDILYQSKIHPETRVNHLSDKDMDSIYNKMQYISKVAIDKEANPKEFPKSFLIHQRKKNGKCYHTGDKIKKTTVGGRTTYYSSGWQKKK